MKNLNQGCSSEMLISLAGHEEDCLFEESKIIQSDEEINLDAYLANSKTPWKNLPRPQKTKGKNK